MRSVAERGCGTPPLPHQMVRIMDWTWRWNPPPPFLPSEWIKPSKTLKKAAVRRTSCRYFKYTYSSTCPLWEQYNLLRPRLAPNQMVLQNLPNCMEEGEPPKQHWAHHSQLVLK